MKIFLVSRKDGVGYDEHDAFVVVARDEQEARLTHPDGTARWKDGRWYEGEREIGTCGTWPVAPADLTVEELGVAAEDQAPGIKLASFNAG
jgi:hypothetical protein